MTRLTKIMGICGFITCLFIMYGTNHGIRGIQLYNRSFRLLDMQFHYNIDIKIILFIVCGLRAIFDITENILLLTMLGRYPVFSKFIATLCSWFTTFKFIMLYIWLLFIAMQTIRYIWLNSHKF
ncbi:MAG: hypothetical protein K0R23_983 [Lacrimispora sp.]|nr:hypothetical protein [Lacrimispora sp.]